jgi:hypothetical protein
MKVNRRGADVADFPPHFRHIHGNVFQGGFWKKKKEIIFLQAY